MSFGVIPSHIMDSDLIKDAEKLLYVRITSLTREKGYCYASDCYLADKCGVDERTIRRRLKKLKFYGFIKIQKSENGKFRMIVVDISMPDKIVQSKKLRRTNLSNDAGQICPNAPIIYINNISNNNTPKSPKGDSCVLGEELEKVGVEDSELKLSEVKSEFSLKEKSSTQESHAPQKNTNLSELEKFEWVLNYLNKTLGRKCRFTENSFKSFKARLKEEYTGNDFKNCILNLKDNKYHVETNYVYVTMEFLVRTATLEKYKERVEQKPKGVVVKSNDWEN